MISFHVGQKVVCIDGQPSSELTKGGWCPRTGGIYTVRSVFAWNDARYLRLEEYRHTGSEGPWGENGWDASRFRPVAKRKTSIEIFKAMLTPSKERVSA